METRMTCAHCGEVYTGEWGDRTFTIYNHLQHCRKVDPKWYETWEPIFPEDVHLKR